jgi:hypothetical protein
LSVHTGRRQAAGPAKNEIPGLLSHALNRIGEPLWVACDDVVVVDVHLKGGRTLRQAQNQTSYISPCRYPRHISSFMVVKECVISSAIPISRPTCARDRRRNRTGLADPRQELLWQHSLGSTFLGVYLVDEAAAGNLIDETAGGMCEQSVVGGFSLE